MKATYSIEHTEHDFFVLRNGERVAKRKTFADAAACALRKKYLEDQATNTAGQKRRQS
jgi:hypothetical protein